METRVLSRDDDGSFGICGDISVHAVANLDHKMFCRVGKKLSMIDEDQSGKDSRWLVIDVLAPCKIYVKDGAVIVSNEDLYP